MTDAKSKSKFWIIALCTLVALAITTTVEDVFDSGVFVILSMPGFIVYVLLTGDIHGWQPGPIGQGGRIVVTTLGHGYFGLP
jgi:hypothetical protein